MRSSLALSALPCLVLALFAPAAPAHAASVQAGGTAAIIRPVSVTKVRDMDFGSLAAPTAGTAVLEPNADSFATTGGLLRVGGTPRSAEFVGSAQSSAVVNIKVPNRPTILTRAGGTETMTVTDFTLQGQSKRTIAQATTFSFRVGGTLNVAANQAEGTYVGTFDVTVQYP